MTTHTKSCRRNGCSGRSSREGIGPLSEVTDRIDLIDQMLFDAGVMVLSAKTGAQRKAADRKIMDARVELDKLRSRFE
ncbi:hypothetical protein PROPHIT492_18 [Mycobacterium phage prophiT49-2]|nr:hypothetical protein PROPHIT492_18 [Mycobacterium phage prophiT49-2]